MRNFLITSVLAVAGMVAGQDQVFSNSEKMLRNLQASPSTHTCTSAITRFKQGLLADNYQSIIGSGQKYTDPYMSGSNMIRWSDYPSTTYSLASFTTKQVAGLKTKLSPVLFGATVSPGDINQGVASDCYALSAAATLASKPERIMNAFITKTYNNEGIFAIKLYIMNRPVVVTVDDNFPWYFNNVLLFAKNSNNGALWGPILEKAFAKINNNYEGINVGNAGEFYEAFNGAPSSQQQMNSISLALVWTDISTAVANGFNVGANSPSSPMFGIVGFHAHSLLGAYQLKNASGQVVKKLFLIRDPHGTDAGYTGNWKDDSPLWTAEYKAQVPYINNKNDGYFFIEDTDFYKAFVSYDVNYYRDNWFNQYYSVENDTTGAKRTFTFTTNQTQEIYLSANFYPTRMYSQGCKTQVTKGLLQIFKGAQQLSGINFSDQWGGAGLIKFASLQAGTYTIQFTPTWTTQDVRDYTIGVYAKEQVAIKDSQGKTNQI